MSPRKLRAVVDDPDPTVEMVLTLTRSVNSLAKELKSRPTGGGGGGGGVAVPKWLVVMITSTLIGLCGTLAATVVVQNNRLSLLEAGVLSSIDAAALEARVYRFHNQNTPATATVLQINEMIRRLVANEAKIDRHQRDGHGAR